MENCSNTNFNDRFFDAFASRSRPLATQILLPDVSRESDLLCELLATKTSSELSEYEIRTVVEGNLWMLAPEAFLYFLPAFLYISLKLYDSVSIFVSELVGALTQPARTDVVESLDRAAQIPPDLGFPDEMMELLREQQLEWIDSGAPLAIFHKRFDSLTPWEGAVILAFFDALQEAHGADFPFDELKIAVDRYWAHYRAS